MTTTFDDPDKFPGPGAYKVDSKTATTSTVRQLSLRSRTSMSQPKNTDPPPNKYNVEAGYKLIDKHQPTITTGFVKDSHRKKSL